MESFAGDSTAVKGNIDGRAVPRLGNGLTLEQATATCRDIARYVPGPKVNGPAPADDGGPSLDVLGVDLDCEAERARELAELAGDWQVPAGEPMGCGEDDGDCTLGEPWEDTDEDWLGREMYEHSTIRHYARRREDRGSRDEMERWGGGVS